VGYVTLQGLRHGGKTGCGIQFPKLCKEKILYSSGSIGGSIDGKIVEDNRFPIR
jgi:hypothetical protein